MVSLRAESDKQDIIAIKHVGSSRGSLSLYAPNLLWLEYYPFSTIMMAKKAFIQVIFGWKLIWEIY
jgi:hypothetical protein